MKQLQRLWRALFWLSDGGPPLPPVEEPAPSREAELEREMDTRVRRVTEKIATEAAIHRSVR